MVTPEGCYTDYIYHMLYKESQVSQLSRNTTP